MDQQKISRRKSAKASKAKKPCPDGQTRYGTGSCHMKKSMKKKSKARKSPKSPKAPKAPKSPKSPKSPKARKSPKAL